MTIYEMRLVAVLGLLAVGAIALVASLAIVHLQGVLRHRNEGTVRELVNRRRAA